MKQEDSKFYKDLQEFYENLSDFRKLVYGRGISRDKLEPIRVSLVRSMPKFKQRVSELTGKYQMGNAYRTFDVWDTALSESVYDSSDLVNRKCLNMLVDVLNEALGTLEAKTEENNSSNQAPVSEAVFPAGKPFDAYKFIKAIFDAVQSELMIADSYMDGTIFDMLVHVNHAVNIKILTTNVKGDFSVAGKKFKEQHSAAGMGFVDVRKSERFHDRFIIADQKVFHLGASIKDAGQKACFINEVEGEEIKAVISKIILGYWEEASVIL